MRVSLFSSALVTFFFPGFFFNKKYQKGRKIAISNKNFTSTCPRTGRGSSKRVVACRGKKLGKINKLHSSMQAESFFFFFWIDLRVCV